MVQPIPPASPTPSPPTGPVLNDDQSSKQGSFLVGGIVILGVLAVLVLSQLGSSDTEVSAGVSVASVKSELAPEDAGESVERLTPESTRPTTTTSPERSSSTSGAAPSTSAASSDSSGEDRSPDNAAEEPVTSVTVKGAWLPELKSGGLHTTTASDLAIGTLAPQIGGMSFEQTPLSIVADGIPKVVVFVAHWCPHCQKEVPQIVQLAEAGLVPEGVQIYAVSTAVDESRGNYPPEAWLEAEGWTFPVVQDNEALELFQAYGGTGFPFAVFLDGEHRVVARAVGSLDIAEMLGAWELLGE